MLSGKFSLSLARLGLSTILKRMVKPKGKISSLHLHVVAIRSMVVTCELCPEDLYCSFHDYGKFFGQNFKTCLSMLKTLTSW